MQNKLVFQARLCRLVYYNLPSRNHDVDYDVN